MFNQESETDTVRVNKQFESFLTFVGFTIMLKLLPVFESLTANLPLKIILGLSISALMIKFFSNEKLAELLRKICDRLKLHISYMYILYIIIYSVVVFTII